jgi:hypothetical protein
MRTWQLLFRRRRSVKPRASAVEHPVRNDFHSVVDETGVNVTFKPTNSTYSFCRAADKSAIARLGPYSFVGVQHGGCNTGIYPSDEVQAMAQQIASEYALVRGQFPDDAASY